MRDSSAIPIRVPAPARRLAIRAAALVGACVALALAGSCAPSVRTEPLPSAERAEARTPAVEVEPTRPDRGDSGATSTTPSPAPSTTPSRTPPPSPVPPVEQDIWLIAQFGATPDDELAAERAFYADLRGAWLRRDEARAFDLLTEELVLRPAHLELRILRAAVALSGAGSGTLPLRLLGGERVDSTDVSVETLLFVIAEFQKGIPERPPARVPWTGLYLPDLVGRLLGSYVSFWSHGLRPLIRNRALASGEIRTFEEFGTGSPSLVETLLTAQLLAARGDVARARKVLDLDLERQVSREYVARWRALLQALDASLNALSVVPASDAHSLLATWEAQVTAAIPEATGNLLILPLEALRRIEAERAGRTRAPASETAPVIPDATALRETLARAASARAAPPSDRERAEHAEMVEEFLAAALRLRDFRADSLTRLRAGDREGVLSEGLLDDLSLRFVENGRLRAVFGGVDDSGPPPEDEGWVVPCGGGTYVWLER